MNKQSFPITPDENKVEELLAKIQPVPSEHFHQKMKQAAWQASTQRPSIKNLRFKVTFAVVVVAALSAILITPQGRAWAQEVFQFFRRVNFTTLPVSERESEQIFAPGDQYVLPLVPVILPTLAPEMEDLIECHQNVQSYACQVAYAEAKLGFDLKEFRSTPQGWMFKTLNFDIASKTASFIYTHYSEHGGDFMLRQGFGKFPTEYGLWSMVPADKVETVKIGQFSGEYVLGSFTLTEGDNAWRWDSSDGIQRLAWNNGERWFYMEVMPPGPGHISRDQLVHLAASLVDSPLERADPLSPDSLASIAAAETYSALDLKAPTLLPMGYEFSYARYFSFNNEVHLHYKYGEDLVVYEWEGKPDDFKALANIYKNHELVEVNGTSAFYGVPAAVSQYESSYLFLAWYDHDLNYRLHFYFNPAWGGGMLDKQKMIAIAESMANINDYKRNQHNSYKYVAIYEKALGFDAKEFSKTPEGWLFTDVYAYPDCMTLSYSAQKENGELIVSQCNTNEMLFPTDIPSNAIEPVKIGENSGQYIIGNFDYDQNGKSVWKMDAPMRHVRWREGDLWMQITLSGDSTILYDKEDLLSYAENLH